MEVQNRSRGEFVVIIDGKQIGPLHLEALGEEARHGRLSGEALVWRMGLAGWTPAFQVPELSAAFDAGPPPHP